MLEIDECRFTPQVALDFFPCHHRPGPLHEKLEHLERLWLKFDEGARLPEFACGGVQLKRAEP